MNRIGGGGMGKKLWSVFTDDMDHCYFTGSPCVERHHIFGGANRAFSEHRGFTVPLRPDLHPNGTQFNPTPANKQIDGILKRMAQEYYESHYGNREEFRREFGKSYI